MGVYKKVKPVDDDEFYREWARANDYCQCCGVPGRLASSQPNCGGVGLSTHHIVKFKRSDEACNLLRLCQRCHNLAEGHTIRQDGVVLSKITLGMCLTLKMFRSPGEFDWRRLEELRGQSLPPMEPVPLMYRKEWCSWSHVAGCECSIS